MLKFILWVSLIVTDFTCEGLIYEFVSPGDNIIFPCSASNSSVDWSGPANDNTNASPVKAVDIYGNIVQWNVSKYSDGLMIDPNLPHCHRLSVITETNGRFDLQLLNVSSSDEGLYLCDVADTYSLEMQYILLIKSLPSDLEIEGTKDTHIVTGIENLEMNLICTVVSGKPPENLTWSNKDNLIYETGHGVIVYSFIPTQADHGTNYTCEARTPLSNTTLSKTVQLNIQYKPNVLIDFESYKTTTEGSKEQLCCNATGNPGVKNISWSKGGTLLKTAYNMSSVCYIFEKINFTDSGNYTCEANNGIGKGLTVVFIQVYYPTTKQDNVYTHFTYKDVKRNLTCQTEVGRLTNYSFYHWEHRSLFGEHIRTLNSTENGILFLPHTNEPFRYQDTGVYICNVSGGIADSQRQYFYQGKITVLSEGLPVYLKFNNGKHFGVTGRQFDMEVIVYSLSDITCKYIEDSASGKAPSSVINTEETSARTNANFHGTNINLNATKIVFHFKKLALNDFKMYNITVCNKYGNSSFVVDLKDKNTYIDSNANNLELPVIMIVLVVMIVAASFVIVKVARKKYKYGMQDEENRDHENEEGQHTYDEIDVIEMSNIQANSSLNVDNLGKHTYCNSLNQLERNISLSGYHNDEQSERQRMISLESRHEKAETDSITSSLDLENYHSSSDGKDDTEIKTLVEVHNATYGQSDDLKHSSDDSYEHPYNSIHSNYKTSIEHRYETVDFYYENVRRKAMMDC